MQIFHIKRDYWLTFHSNTFQKSACWSHHASDHTVREILSHMSDQ